MKIESYKKHDRGKKKNVYSLTVPLFFLIEGTEKDKVLSIFCGGAIAIVHFLKYSAKKKLAIKNQ